MTVFRLSAAVDRARALTRALLGNQWRLWLCLWAAAAVVHFGTAALRLGSFVPFPEAVDFSSYYAGAWAYRLGLTPYEWSPAMIDTLMTAQALPSYPPAHNSSPLWAMVMLPMTTMPFPVAAAVWLCLLLLCATFSHILLARIAGYHSWGTFVATFPLTLTFGPLFLNLTLGQNGIFLLFAALLLGQALKDGRSRLVVPALVSWVFAVAAKIYPVLWIGCLFFLRRWRFLLGAVFCLLLGLGGAALLEPRSSVQYWLGLVPNRAAGYASSVDVDDQSLVGFLGRIGRSTSFAVPGLGTAERLEVIWRFPWELPQPLIQGVSVLLLTAIGGTLAASWCRGVEWRQPEDVLYGIVLFGLLISPHMARYNHVLVLPAMARLWRLGFGYRHWVIIAYFLFAVSRLTHLWVAVLPTIGGALLSGSGILGVLLLLFALQHSRAQRGPV